MQETLTDPYLILTDDDVPFAEPPPEECSVCGGTVIDGRCEDCFGVQCLQCGTVLYNQEVCECGWIDPNFEFVAEDIL